MLLNVVMVFTILALIAWVVGVLTFRIVMRLRYPSPGAAIPGRPSARLMSPIEWTSITLALILWGMQGFLPGSRRQPRPVPDSTPVRLAPASQETIPPANTPRTEPPANAPQSKPLANAPAAGAAGTASHTQADTLPTGSAVEERRWCNQGDRMMAVGQYSMAAQAYWEAVRAQPGSERARTGLARARRAVAGELASQREAAIEASDSEYGSGGAYEGPARRGTESSATAHVVEGEWGRQQDARFHRERGDHLLGQGMAHAAIGEYQKAVESDPSDMDAREGLDRARRQSNASRTRR